MDVKAFGIKPAYKKKDGKFVLDKKGRKIVEKEEYFINPLAQYIKPYTLVPRNADLNPNDPEQIEIPGSGQSADVIFEMPDEGLFEGAYLTAQFEDDQGSQDTNPAALVELIDSQRKVSLTGRPCHVQTVLGNGQRPFVLPETLPIDKRQPVIIRFHNLTASDLYVRPQIHGRRYYSEQVRDKNLDNYIKRRQERNRHMSLYMCPLDTDPQLANNTNQADYYFTNDYSLYFEVRKIMVWSEGVFKFVVIDEKSNAMSSGWVHTVGGVGVAQYPFIFYGPWMIQPGGKVTLRTVNLAGATNQIKVTLAGRQHFTFPGP